MPFRRRLSQQRQRQEEEQQQRSDGQEREDRGDKGARACPSTPPSRLSMPRGSEHQHADSWCSLNGMQLGAFSSRRFHTLRFRCHHQDVTATTAAGGVGSGGAKRKDRDERGVDRSFVFSISCREAQGPSLPLGMSSPSRWLLHLENLTRLNPHYPFPVPSGAASSRRRRLRTTACVNGVPAEVIALEVLYDDVQGVNYANPLVADTTLTLEAARVTLRGFTSERELEDYYRTPTVVASAARDDFAGPGRRDAGTNIDGDGGQSTDTCSSDAAHNRQDGRAEDGSLSIAFRTLTVSFSDASMPAELRTAFLIDRRLLRMCETGIPAWAIFFGTCGLYYRPWMRRLADHVFIAVSMVSLFIGFYDLYKNIPWARELMIQLFRPLVEWVEENPFWRLSILFGYLFAKSPALYAIVTQVQRLAVGLAAVARLIGRSVANIGGFVVPEISALVRVWQYAFALAWRPVTAIFRIIFDANSPVTVLLIQPLSQVAGVISWIFRLFTSSASIGAAASSSVPLSSTSVAMLLSPRSLVWSLSTLWSTLLSKIVYVLRAMLFLLLFLADKLTRHRYSLSLSIASKLQEIKAKIPGQASSLANNVESVDISAADEPSTDKVELPLDDNLSIGDGGALDESDESAAGVDTHHIKAE